MLFLQRNPLFYPVFYGEFGKNGNVLYAHYINIGIGVDVLAFIEQVAVFAHG